MYLKKLEISGFKSFASKTTLDFLIDSKNGTNQGITAIVGPNGSGKSNIADALRWVMGEQSMKNLRGKKSEDIIFAGSGKKARLGSAYVTLYLDNSDKRIPLEFEEVSVTRKIFRSGESEYLINGSRVRLQDIVDILAKAGVGKESYAVVNQGMADAVLNATPFERRSVIEDAAGVKQYQIKKERSLRKLDSTRQNLERAKELIEEIKPHLRMLKRQADKAAESEGVMRELAEKQTKLFSHLWHNFQQERNRLNEEKEQSGRILINMQREVDKLTDEIGDQSKEEKNQTNEAKHLELENKQREQRNKLNQLERELIITEGRIEIEKEKQKNVEMIRETEISLPKEQLVDRAYIKEKLEEIKKEQEKLIEKIERAEKMEDLQDIKEFARVVGQQLYDLKVEIEKGKKEIVPVVAPKPVAVEKKAVEKIESKVLIELQERIIKIREDIGKAQEELLLADQEMQQEILLDREKRRKFFEIEGKLRIRQDELNKLKDKFNDSKIVLARVEVREEDLKNQIKTELRKEAEELAPIEGEINRENLEQEIHKLKIKMEQIGGIDPMVIDEYNETQKRFEFLDGESRDLEEAIVSLREVVKEMDQKIEGKFAATFEEINKEFSKYFRIIFGGGTAHLTKFKIQSSKRKAKEEAELAEGEAENKGEKDEIIEEENKEEERNDVGIDISACPPGKRIANLSMLSGGERSLTSLALLFAIISHNPPPFAILDEVEAALDEANSRRFGRILTELSGSTQFVTITHNRETMRQASLLYGVTMGEEGISKLLSVKLDQIGQGGKIIAK
ncbi:MAG: AAA family ATPase [bacterium]|nr:AAA family ATPase [bacterium]